MAAIAQFLKENDLSVDTTVEVFITVTRDDRLIACGGIAGNIIKCVAICESVRGEGLALTLATELINLAYERHCTHLFIYTKTEYEFYVVAKIRKSLAILPWQCRNTASAGQ